MKKIFQTSDFIGWELVIAAVYVLFNILIKNIAIEGWIDSFCKLPQDPRCNAALTGMNCSLSDCASLLQSWANFLIFWIFILYFVIFIIYRTNFYFKNRSQTQTK